jgi:hypothetical protein
MVCLSGCLIQSLVFVCREATSAANLAALSEPPVDQPVSEEVTQPAVRRLSCRACGDVRRVG